MNPMLKQLMAGLTATAKENLVEDAVDANKTADTTDPEQVQKNVDFQAELERLKNLQGDNSAADSAATDPSTTEGEEGSSGNDAGNAGDAGDSGEAGEGSGEGETTADPEAGGETDPEQKPDDNQPEEDPGNGDVEASDDAEDDEAAEPPMEEAEVAQEALKVAAEALGAICRAHEFGVVRPHHVALFDTALESQRISVGIVATPAISRESDMPEGAASRLRYVAGRIKEFLKEVLAKMREYYGKVMNWIKAAFQAFNEHHGRFQKNTEGLLKRIDYLKGKERPQEEIQELAEKKAISLRALATSSEAPTADSIAEAISVITAVGNGIYYSVTQNAAFGPLVDLVSRVSEHDMERVLVGDVNAVTPERMFRISGSSSVFANSHIYKNVSRVDTALGGMVDFSVEKLLGLNAYHWELAKDDANNIDEVVHHNHGYGFKVATERQDVQAPLLTSLDDCKAVLQLSAPLLKELLRFKDVEKVFASTQALFVKNQDMMKQLVDLIDLDEELKIKVLMVHSTSQSAYTNLFVKSATNHIKVIDAAIAALHRWVAESLNIIAAEKAA